MRLILILCCLLASFKGIAQQVIELVDVREEYHMGIHTTYFVDSAATLTFEQAQQRAFMPSKKRLLFFGINHAAYWVKLQTRNLSESNQWLLKIDFPILDSLDIYEVRPDGTVRTINTGFCRPFNTRPIEHASFAIPLDLVSGSVHTFYIRVKSRKTKLLPISLTTEQQFFQQKSTRDLGYGLYFGMILIMAMYNLVIFIGLRDRSYLYYALMLLASVGVFASSSGYTFQYLWPNLPSLNQYVLIWFTCLLVILNALFSQSFLNLRTHRPKLWMTMNVISGISALALFTTVFATFITGIVMYYVLTFLSIMMVWAGVARWQKGDRSAKLFVLGWVWYIAGAILIMLKNWGLLPNSFITTHSAEIGSVMLVTILAMAMADRYRHIRREKEQAVREKLEAEEAAKRDLEKKVEERTGELLEMNEELNLMVEELHVTNEQLNATNIEVVKKNKAITDSINYAKRIQFAFLPLKSRIGKAFPEHFILFKPKDLVSGDFYWFEQVSGKYIFVVADCTGHGVPGAFMSLLGNDSLVNVVVRQGIVEPSVILHKLDAEIRHILRQDFTENRDGMDLSICVVDPVAHTLSFAGAKRPLVYFDKAGAMQLIKGDKFSMGGGKDNMVKKFETTVLATTDITEVYMFSDGYADQFGGVNAEKLLIRRLYGTLEKIHRRPMDEQENLLDHQFEEWKAGHKQTDDVLVVGFRVS